jgi:hypothetical protein
MKNNITAKVLALLALFGLVAPLAARADGGDPTTTLMTTASTYWGYLTADITTVGGLVLGVAIIAVVIMALVGWLHKGHGGR